ncbi:SelR-domain-containing protein [Mytilinidion resinicola]|uniref:Peptide-methionine (R)-S-oxide reductase n=1 Tax=Mytilinidion resinicola TaxID=574789 RepID=A0A6A6Y100_9PEZI|nr:SelR-domain-containing protein [Mytilinidion resinicola]KAF2802486.1 SelR-domain-containing protein [Mytilinidion resinicola]
MRFPSIPTILRAFNTFSNTTFHSTPVSNLRGLNPNPRIALLKSSMPTIPFIGSLFSSSSKPKMSDSYPVQKNEGEWQAQLNKEQFRILRQKGTEFAGTGKYDKHYPSSGVYTCVGCDAPLYKASHKFDSGCGWPAFFDAVPGAIQEKPDGHGWSARTEILCANCGGHLGHIFKGEKFGNPKDERHCVNSVSINFSKEEGDAAAAEKPKV